MDGVYDYARMLATEVSPASLAATKLQMYTDLHRDAATRGRATPSERLRAMMTGPDFAEGVAAPDRLGAPRASPIPRATRAPDEGSVGCHRGGAGAASGNGAGGAA